MTKIVIVGGAPQTGSIVGVRVSPGTAVDPGESVPWDSTSTVGVERDREGPRGRNQVVITQYPPPASTVTATSTRLVIFICLSVNWLVRKSTSFENKFFIIFFPGINSHSTQLPLYLIT